MTKSDDAPSADSAHQSGQLEEDLHRAYRDRAMLLADRLRHVLSFNSTNAEVLLRAAIAQVESGEIDCEGETPAGSFAELCECAGAAYPAEPTDADIFANAATPDLVRYMLRSMGAYGRQVGLKGVLLGDPAARELARAFRLKRDRPGSPGKFNSRRLQLVEAAQRASFAAQRNGKNDAQTMEAAVDAAYEVFRCDDSGAPLDAQDDKDRRKTRNALRKFLKDQREKGHW